MQKDFKTEKDNVEIEASINPFKIYPFNTVNLAEIKNKLKVIANSIIDEKFISLFIHYLKINNLNKYIREVLEDFTVKPFDDKLGVKTLLCLQFYIEEDYIRCY